MHKNYLAESIGTFVLALAVIGASHMAGAVPLAVPVIAALIVGIFVYTIGPISGCHLNPAVTVGAWSVGKIGNRKALWYVVAQLVGAFAALIVADPLFGIVYKHAAPAFTMGAFAAEIIGAFLLTFGIASVVYGNVKAEASGLVIGGSLLLGVIMASLSGSLGVLNPAVAVAIGVTSILYVVAPLLGGVAGFFAYRFIAEKE